MQPAAALSRLIRVNSFVYIYFFYSLCYWCLFQHCKTGNTKQNLKKKKNSSLHKMTIIDFLLLTILKFPQNYETLQFQLVTTQNLNFYDDRGSFGKCCYALHRGRGKCSARLHSIYGMCQHRNKANTGFDSNKTQISTTSATRRRTKETNDLV